MSDEIFGYLRTRIGRRFFAVFLVISLVPLGVMRWMAIRKSEAAIQEQTFGVLTAASDGAEAQLRDFLENLQQNLRQVAHDETLIRVLSLADSAPAPANSRAALTPVLSSRRPLDVQEVFVMNAAGRVIASTVPQNTGADYSTNDVFIKGGESFFAGDVLKDAKTGKPTWIMSAPVKDPVAHEVLGVLAFRINPETLSGLTTGRRILAKGANTQSLRIGDTGETYIVNSSGVMITESRFIPDAVLKRKVDTAPVRAGLERGQEMTGQYKDYRGKTVSGSSLVLQNPNWILITEIDFTQAFAPIRRLQNELIIAAVALIFLAIVFAWSCTWRVVKPIRLLSEADRALAERDEAGAFVSEEGLPEDEIGQLVRHRNARVKSVFDYQRLLEDRTTKLQEMVSEIEHISYAIVHDMRAPLRAMQGFASLLEADGADTPPEVRKIYLRNISAAAVRLDHLIRDVLTYNRTVLRHAALHPVDLHALVVGILDTYPNLSREKADITIRGRLPSVIGNEALLTQCFANILDNAVKFVAPGVRPHILIWSEPSPERAAPLPAMTRGEEINAHSTAAPLTRIWIEDNGIGIPKNAQPRLFRMFQRLTEDDRGTGVGLAIVHKVIEQMGGAVGAESEPGKGSRFWFDLRPA